MSKEIIINLKLQALELHEGEDCLAQYIISSGKNGIGQEMGSEQTPLGRHMIYRKIGTDALINTVFVHRRATGEIYTPELDAAQPGRDWILTRILWLMGLEPGYNRFGQRDTRNRYIYIHGTPDSTILGQTGSKGCIRMRNLDIIDLFDMVEEGGLVTLIS
jgi:lipoprotein-anchoring transpeptidase ErfK/SrfK